MLIGMSNYIFVDDLLIRSAYSLELKESDFLSEMNAKRFYKCVEFW